MYETPRGMRAGPVLLRAGNCGKSLQRRRGGRPKLQAPRIRWAGKVLTVSRPSPHLAPLTPLPAPSSYRGRDAISLKAVSSNTAAGESLIHLFIQSIMEHQLSTTGI